MSGWARSDRTRYRAASPSPLDDFRYQTHTKAAASTSKRLEKGIHAFEEALSRCDTDNDAYKSTLELYASHVQTQRADIAALRAELERAKKPATEYRNTINVFQSNLTEKESECVELRSRVKKLETRLQSQDKSLDACCSQLSEERQWRRAAMECLQNKLSLAKETAGLVSSIQKKKTTTPVTDTSSKTSKLTRKNLEIKSKETNHNNTRPRSAPSCPRSETNTSEESLLQETELSQTNDSGDYENGALREEKEKGKGREKEWTFDITAVSAVVTR